MLKSKNSYVQTIDHLAFVMHQLVSIRPTTPISLSNLKKRLDRRISILKWRPLQRSFNVALDGENRTKLIALTDFAIKSCPKLQLDPFSIFLVVGASIDQNAPAVFGKLDNGQGYIVALTPDFFEHGTLAANKYVMAFALSSIAQGTFESDQTIARMSAVKDRHKKYQESGGTYRLQPPLRRMARRLRFDRIFADNRALMLFPTPEEGLDALAAMQSVVEKLQPTAVEKTTVPTAYLGSLRPAARMRVARRLANAK